VNPGLVLVGGGGHCRSCIEVIEAEDRYRIVGIIDPGEASGSKVCGYQVLGGDDLLPGLAEAGHHFLITVGQIKSPAARLRLWRILASLGGNMASVLSPSARVSRRARVGAGSIVMHNAVINTGARIGENCIINTGALVEHEAEVGSHSHVSTGAVVNGGAAIGERTFLGSGCVVSNRARVGSDCIVGASALVLGEIAGPGTFAGIPARKLAEV
jgi:sugar O-acyltransferase (sialic acid O-acetyltransferase NeuD family)